MKTRNSLGLLAYATVVLALLSGCGSSSTKSIPTTVTTVYAHNLVFRNNTAMVMGYNGFGQLGLNSLDDVAVATPVTGTGPVHGGATGGVHTLAFGNRTTVVAWGYNYYGQLGNGQVSTGNLSNSYSKVPVIVGGFNSGIVSSVAAGAYHSLAVAGGKVFAWGYNGSGQIGNDNFNNQATPFAVKNPVTTTSLGTDSNPAIQVAAGANHSLALLSDGTVWGWGSNSDGQLGFDPASVNGLYSTTPRQISWLLAPHKVIQVVADGSNSYALADDNTVWAWGYNFDGELGVDPISKPFSFTPVQVMMVDGVTPLHATKISAGGNHVLALEVVTNSSATPPTTTYTVWAWGYNGFGQLGNNSTTNSFVPVVVQGLTGVIDKVQAFGDYSMAHIVGSDVIGDWWGWGDNGNGQLANPVATTSLARLLVPATLKGYRP